MIMIKRYSFLTLLLCNFNLFSMYKFDISGFSDSDSDFTGESLYSNEEDRLYALVLYNNIDALRKYFNNDPTINLDKQYKDGNTLLHWACQLGYLNIVKFLIVKKASLNIENDEGNTPIQEAIDTVNVNVIKYFYKIGILDLDEKSIKETFESALYKTISEFDEGLFKDLLFLGVEVKPFHISHALKLGNFIAYRLLKLHYNKPIFHFYNKTDNKYWP